MSTQKEHPATRWLADAQRLKEKRPLRLRLAAMAGHIQLDKVAARRAALIDLLADGRPHLREEIWAEVARQLSKDCWGKRPEEALARDLHALRLGGVRIAYSRKPECEGYYLQYPPIARRQTHPPEPINWAWVEHVRQLSVPEKNQQLFAAADFALRQKRLILAEEHPEWSEREVDTEARRLVYGVNDHE